MNEESQITRAWELYEKGRAYNNRLVPNQYRLVNTNIEFFAGNQWRSVPETPAMARLPKPVFNIIKRVASLFVASLTSSGAAIRFEPLEGTGGSGAADAADAATAEVANLLEKFKMEYRIREALFDGAQTGDYCAHFWWDPEALPYGGALGGARGEVRMELVDGINVMFGNPNTPSVEDQPYILIVGRDTLLNLRAEAGRHGAELEPDSEYGFQAGSGGKVELEPGDGEGKALYVYLYTKVPRRETVEDPVTGERRERTVATVHVTKATRTAVIFDDVDTGLTRYPVAWGNWERQKNQYHGRALVTGIIPNQIFINTMFAMAMRHLQLLGFPKTVYNADLVGPWSGEVGQAVGVRGLQPGQPVSQVAYNLQPADMSNQILTVIDRAVSYTKDCLGATDAQLGSIRPDNTSALMVLQSSAEVPLENTRAGLHEWLEDVGAILLDMMGTYYGVRPVVRERVFEEPAPAEDGGPAIGPDGLLATVRTRRRVAETFDFTVFKRLWLRLRADVGASSYYSEIASAQTLDNLRAAGVLDVVQYLERVPEGLIPRKAELIAELKKRMGEEDAGEAETGPVGNENSAGPAGNGLDRSERDSPAGGRGAAPARSGRSGGKGADLGGVLRALPGSVQARWRELPAVARRALAKKAGRR